MVFVKWKRGYAYVTLGFLLLSIAGHWAFAWPAYVDWQQEDGLPILFDEFAVMMFCDTFEDWQSEFCGQFGR